jgi:hypothetical protein
MIQVSTLPAVFLASVNCTGAGNKTLKYLVREEKFIAKTLADAASQAFCQVIRKSDLTPGEFITLLKSPETRSKVSILHLSGHVSGNTLTFDCGPEQGEIEISKLSSLVAKLPNLHVVYLSGCATNELVEMLLLRDVPVVIATETKDEGIFSASIARSFYQSMAAGLSVRDTYEQLRLMYGALLPHRKVSYNLEDNRLEWQGKLADEAEESFPWGMYVLEDNDHKLDWKLRKYLNLKDYSLTNKISIRARLGRSMNWVLPALVATAVAAGIFFFLGDKAGLENAFNVAILTAPK